MMNKFFIAILLSIFAISCSKPNWEQTGEAVIVYPQQAGKQQAQAIKITPLHNEIIKVSASATKIFGTKESLVALPLKGTVPFVVDEYDDHLIISTAKTIVMVS
ncbi:MAG: alpha-xylosidase, partial [Draconibacterium sp.]